MQNVVVDRAPVRLRRPARLLRLASDERLVALVRTGDEGAFEALYDRHHPAILGFCRHMLGTREEAEDAVQHTFLAAYRDLVASDKPIELRPWLFAIARNRCCSLLRARRAHAEIELVEPATDGLSATVERREDLRELLADLATLPDDQRAALLLAELGALDHAGIATALGCPREKVKALVFQARSSLAANRAARATPCEQIRLELASASGATLRRGPLRRHLRICPGCRAFKAEVATQRKLLALALPVVPTVALKTSVLSGSVGGASASGGGAVAAVGVTTGASSGTTGGLLGAAASAGAGKLAVTLAVAGVVAGGGALAEQLHHHGGAATPGAAAHHDAGPAAPARSVAAAPRGHAKRSGDGAASSRSAAPVGASGRRELAPAEPTQATSPAAQQLGTAIGGGTSTGTTTTATPPPPAQRVSAPGRVDPPPGQTRTPPGHGGTPPGQAKKQNETGRTPPGQAKKQDGADGASPGATPGGQTSPPPGNSGSAPGYDKHGG